eukprot:gnl/TRDRNA2_/TRDRNA2_74002_c0_seq1.p2 gnl/TRDRNA2_/TRDRNA2_74002_c0~~gnl/TRDRNA2_/TRDRNA2_74002_c0_seq1.p2  ORF type:complete len:112 (+),score=3.00 gnl/TRDRNA2_/TRDRNA2_74002_c0_seq1:45-338(+)
MLDGSAGADVTPGRCRCHTEQKEKELTPVGVHRPLSPRPSRATKQERFTGTAFWKKHTVVFKDIKQFFADLVRDSQGSRQPGSRGAMAAPGVPFLEP